MCLFDGMTASASAIRLQEFDIINKAETSNRATGLILRASELRPSVASRETGWIRTAEFAELSACNLSGRIALQLPGSCQGWLSPPGREGLASPRIWDAAEPKTRIQV